MSNAGSTNGSVYPVKQGSDRHYLVDSSQYNKLYKQSVDDNEIFWAEQARTLAWDKPFTIVKDVSLVKEDLHIRWFEDGELNVCVNCVDRHLADRAEQTAIIFEGDQPDVSSHITYRELHAEVCKLANALEALGIQSGDRVMLYMPMIPEAAYAMLACARIGAVHSVVFGGFSANALADRIADCGAKMVITADMGKRGSKAIPLKVSVDEALTFDGTDGVEHVLVVKNTGDEVNWVEGRDHWYAALTEVVSAEHQAKSFPAEHPLFILYTSGSTGKPKGLQHTSAGYLLYSASTFRYVFDYQEGDIYWCTADVGWITGHSYIVYGPLAEGATTLMFEGVPNYPDLGRFGEVIDKHKVTQFYTAPTAIRLLMSDSATALAGSKRSSLRILGTVGEPINPDVWRWYHDEFGHGQCPIVDTWWQTETGANVLTPIPGVTTTKPGSCTLPLPGMDVDVVNEEGESITEANKGGYLVIKKPWPSMLSTIWGDDQRYIDTYFPKFGGKYYLAGDSARRDEDGYFWIMGRIDDVLNVSGHRLGTMEVESALVAHDAVVEAAVVGRPHEVKGESIVAFVICQNERPVGEAAEKMVAELRNWVGEQIGAIAKPDDIRFADGLPKTRSGKIMRRLLRTIAAGEEITSDISTLENEAVVAQLQGEA